MNKKVGLGELLGSVAVELPLQGGGSLIPGHGTMILHAMAWQINKDISSFCVSGKNSFKRKKSKGGKGRNMSR